MLITFRSKADADVIMFGAVGQAMIAALGKDPADHQGIITEAQLPHAIERLLEAVAESKHSTPREDSHDEPAHDAHHIPEPTIPFFKRAVPLLEMLRHAQHAGEAVIWESDEKPA